MEKQLGRKLAIVTWDNRGTGKAISVALAKETGWLSLLYGGENSK